MNKHLITALFLIAALACYFAGMTRQATFLLVLGAAAELVFWVRIFRRK